MNTLERLIPRYRNVNDHRKLYGREKAFFVAITIVVNLLISNGVTAMSIFFGGEETEIVLFSKLEGQLTYEGKPASNAQIKLWIAWKDEKGESFYYEADTNGFFIIPALKIKSKQSPLAQLSIGQMIHVSYLDKEYLIWRAGKSTGKEFGELGGQPVNLSCELTKPELDPHLDHSLVKTRCVWDSLI